MPGVQKGDLRSRQILAKGLRSRRDDLLVPRLLEQRRIQRVGLRRDPLRIRHALRVLEAHGGSVVEHVERVASDLEPRV
jgi:hypothetical protein